MDKIQAGPTSESPQSLWPFGGFTRPTGGVAIRKDRRRPPPPFGRAGSY